MEHLPDARQARVPRLRAPTPSLTSELILVEVMLRPSGSFRANEHAHCHSVLATRPQAIQSNRSASRGGPPNVLSAGVILSWSPDCVGLGGLKCRYRGGLLDSTNAPSTKMEIRRGVRPVLRHVGRSLGKAYETPLDGAGRPFSSSRAPRSESADGSSVRSQQHHHKTPSERRGVHQPAQCLNRRRRVRVERCGVEALHDEPQCHDHFLHGHWCIEQRGHG